MECNNINSGFLMKLFPGLCAFQIDIDTLLFSTVM